MATGVVVARELVSELDCHAHDTVSAMCYRERSASARVRPEACVIILNLEFPVYRVHFASPVVATGCPSAAPGYVNAGGVIVRHEFLVSVNLFPAVFKRVGVATVVV